MGIKINGNVMLNGRIDSDKKINKIKFGNSLVWEYKAPEYLYLSTGVGLSKYNIKTLAPELTFKGIGASQSRIWVDQDFIYYASYRGAGILNKEDFSEYHSVTGWTALDSPRRIIAKGDYVYVSFNSIKQYLKSSMIETNSFRMGAIPILDFAVDGNYIYIPNYLNSSSLYIEKLDWSTDAHVALSQSFFNQEARVMVEDGDYIFCTIRNKSDQSLSTKVFLKSDMSLVVSSIGSFNRMVIDGDYLYGVSKNVVSKVHKTNFSKTDIITGTFSSDGIAVSRYKIFVGLPDGSVNIYSKTDYSLLGNLDTGEAQVLDMQIGT